MLRDDPVVRASVDPPVQFPDVVEIEIDLILRQAVGGSVQQQMGHRQPVAVHGEIPDFRVQKAGRRRGGHPGLDGRQIQEGGMQIPVIRIDQMIGAVFHQRRKGSVQHGRIEFAFPMESGFVTPGIQVNDHQLVKGSQLQGGDKLIRRGFSDQILQKRKAHIGSLLSNLELGKESATG